jgi:GDP-D-mannose dehydratase
MNPTDKIYIAGHRGLVGTALMRNLTTPSTLRGAHPERHKSRGEGEKFIVAVDPRYFRPTEVETLLGDPSKARNKLGWTPKISFSELVAEMVREDLKAAERDELVKKHGYKAMDYHE